MSDKAKKQRAFSPLFHPIRYLMRKMMANGFNTYTEILMTDNYDENAIEIITATLKTGIQVAIENELRSAGGAAIDRPLGTSRKFPSLDELLFSIGQLYIMPQDFEDPVDTKVIIGKRAKSPLTIDIPILIAPMAYGTALSKGVKIAYAKASAQLGTAATSGEGPILDEEFKEAKHYILQYNRGDWAKDEETLRKVDAIEIQFGQGAIGGVGSRIKAENIDAEMRKYFKYPAGKDIVAHSRQPEVQHPKDVAKLVEKLKDITGGRPIGAKIGAGKYLEADLDILCSAGIDFITVDSAEAGTKGSVPILQDDFGVPTPFAISRTAEWLYKHNFKEHVTLLASGKIRAPGDMLKACALGADACYVGNAALFSVAHTQALKTLPFEPVTQLVWHTGQFEDDFDIEAGATSVANYLKACTQELEKGVRALGKTRLADVNKGDLCALSEVISKGCGVPMCYEPYEYEDKFKGVQEVHEEQEKQQGKPQRRRIILGKRKEEEESKEEKE
ncbi:glutamate synthase domain-containing protein 2 [Anaerosolibacter carboniphilus]|uniref:Glutamate synthase domain-containing protein 2 n=1 Tax=Anaerosolibacter carboniphilus TaxID=1417629 RepID=A0A841L0S3_9FIRM|nr:FMN-binding glutamate synthase family protein [Anaerosolibacter carboniphilus]MBB6216772.1 glutamate synthase domain-containing protein 2 [Anaerosolibacter carboniphilus]